MQKRETKEEELGEEEEVAIGEVEELGILQEDPHLHYFKEHFQRRTQLLKERLAEIKRNEGGLLRFGRSYQQMGFFALEEGLVKFREWLPNAMSVYLMGDMNNWSRKDSQWELSREEYGYFSIVVPRERLSPGMKVKLHIVTRDCQVLEKVPAQIRGTHQNEDKSYDGVYLDVFSSFPWEPHSLPSPGALKIYECHIGMAGVEERVHSFNEFTRDMLPRIKAQGYNTIQIMGLMEHSYYGSFGYHVTNYFAVSSRFGSRLDFQRLVQEAHRLGLRILVDIVHSHASKNSQDGINLQDGTDYQYFHSGAKGEHPQWDSRCFDYAKYETLRFLLGNLLCLLEELRVDGFRFDGVTSMLYSHHGHLTAFSGDYREYFSGAVDLDCAVYLQLANLLVHAHHPQHLTIAEDVSGMPGLAQPVLHGGLGFDFRLQMAVADYWIKLLKEQRDEDWNMHLLAHLLTNRRHDEQVVAYCESHDQALVGDKTLAMWLFDAQIYTCMSTQQEETLQVSRGMALHKMVRLLTMTLAGDAYLNFMGNEFGHPQWIDFPREGNNWSYHHCIRRFDLADDSRLRYSQLNAFDKAMLALDSQMGIMARRDNFVVEKNEEDKLLVYEKAGLLFVFNFHPSRSLEHYRVGCNSLAPSFRLLFDTDRPCFGGHARLKQAYLHTYLRYSEPWHQAHSHLRLYLPSRSALVLAPN